MAPKKIIPVIKKYEAGIHRFFSASNSTLIDLTNTVSEVMTISQTGIVASNLTVYGGLSVENTGMFRNRIMNGDMRVDQRGTVTGGAVSLPGTGAGSSAAPSTVYSVDRWAIATGSASGTLCAAQVPLSSTDQAAVEGRFTNAVAIGVSPAVGLSAYMPFNGNVLDVSGNGNNMTATGSMAYVPGRVSGTAVYLANEANITAVTAAANYIRNTAYVFSSTFTVAYWILYTKLNGGEATMSFITNTGAGSSPTGSLFICGITTGIKVGIWGVGDSGAVSSIALNTWYHYAVVYKPGTAQLFVNGTSIVSYSGTLVQNGFMIGNSTTTYVTQAFAGYIDEFRIYNRALSATEIAALANVAPVTVAPTSSLITRLTFDNVTTDAQGTLPAPVATGTTAYSTSSKSGTASLDLSGNTAGGTMTVGQTYTLSSGSFSLPLSMGVWLNSSSPTTAAYQVPINIGNNTAANTLAVEIYFDIAGSGKIFGTCHIGGTGYTSPISPFALNAGTWYHCTLTVSNTFIQLYINGVMVSSRATGVGTLGIRGGTGASGSPTQLRIGGETGTAVSFGFKGLVDDVRIYNRELSASEIAGLYYSYQNAAYMLYQQPIEGLNVADLAWGTSAAQSASVSAWIKNNTASTQQFSLSAGNAGAAAALSAITFETSSGINDTLGFLTNPVGTNVVYSTSIYKVGTRSLDFTANTAGGTATSFVTYNYNYSTSSLSVSTWFNTPNSTTDYQYIVSIGNNDNFALILGNGIIYVNAVIGGTNYQVYYTFAYTPNTWYHICGIINSGFVTQLYINGILVGVSSSIIPITINLTPSIIIWIGRRDQAGNAFKGYIDDVRIFEKALTAAEVFQIYNRNVAGTTISQYLLPRSYIYTTPSIPAGAWQKISFTIPGDTTDAAWAKDTTCGVNLALCLGASAPYVGANVTAGWSSAQYFTGSNIQAYGASANNFLADAGNSIYLTGVQFEKGAMTSPFEIRPYSEELQLCQRYFETMSVVDQGGSQTGSQWASSTYKVVKRAVPTFSYTNLYGAFEPTLTYVDSFRLTRSGADPAVYGLRIDAEL